MYNQTCDNKLRTYALLKQEFEMENYIRERSLFTPPGGPRKNQGGSRTFHFLDGEGHEHFEFSTGRVMNFLSHGEGHELFSSW